MLTTHASREDQRWAWLVLAAEAIPDETPVEQSDALEQGCLAEERLGHHTRRSAVIAGDAECAGDPARPGKAFRVEFVGEAAAKAAALALKVRKAPARFADHHDQISWRTSRPSETE